MDEEFEEEKPEETSERKESRRPRRDFNSSERGFGGPRRDFAPREMHKAICSQCKQECEVPFKPAEGREVFCKDCYRKKKRY